MKEVTYKEWIKNPIPRMMWCWDNDEKCRIKQKVIYVCNNPACLCPVATIIKECEYSFYQHCAEIEKQSRMTNKELSWWLSEKPHREYKFARAPYIYTYYTYNENEQDEEVSDDLRIREDDGEWREPLVEE